MKKKTQILLIIIVGLICYTNSLFNGFVWDDEFLIQNNVQIRSWDKAFQYAISCDIFPGNTASQETNYYRPLQILSYAVDFSIWGLRALGFHLTSVMLHIANALLVFFLFSLLSGNNLAAFLTALFFVAHPLYHSAVSYISGRADLLAAFFILSSLILFIKFRRRDRQSLFDFYFLSSMLCFFFALLSKEYALVVPVLFLTFDYCFTKLKKESFLPYSLYVAPAVIYILMRMQALGFNNALLGGRYASLLSGEFSLRLFTFLKSIPLYIAILVAPINLHMERVFTKPQFFFDQWVWISALFLISGSVILFNKRRQKPLLLFLYLWFLLLVFSQSYVFLPGFSFSEHFLYLAALSMFFIFARAFVCLISSLREKARQQRLVVIILVSLGLFYASLTIIHNFNWRDNLTFYRWTLKFSPKSIKAHINLANTYFLLERDDLALPEYERAKELLESVRIEHYKDKPVLDRQLWEAIKITHYNLGVIYCQRQAYERSEQEYREALRIDNNFNLARNNLAALLTNIKRDKEALEQLQLLLSLDPDNVKAYYNLGVIYANTGKRKLAQEAWFKGLSLEPGNDKIQSALKELQQRR